MHGLPLAESEYGPLMKIAVLQMESVAGNRQAALDEIDAHATSAAAAGVQVMVAPELALCGYGCGSVLSALATTSEEAQAALGPLARRHGLVLAVGFAERTNRGIYNSVLMTDGARIYAVYRKSHLYGDYERAQFTPAPPSTVVIEAFEMRIAPLICYDVEFQENCRRLARAGVDLILAPTALPDGPSSRFIARQLIRVRAFENHVFIAYADLHGHDDQFCYSGLSAIAAPDGSLLAKAPARGAALLTAPLHTADYEQTKRENDYLHDLGRYDA